MGAGGGDDELEDRIQGHRGGVDHQVVQGRVGRVASVQAAVHSYVVGFWVSAAILAGSAVVCALVLPSGTLTPAVGPSAPSAPSAARPREEMSVRDPRAV